MGKSRISSSVKFILTITFINSVFIVLLSGCLIVVLKYFADDINKKILKYSKESSLQDAKSVLKVMKGYADYGAMVASIDSDAMTDSGVLETVIFNRTPSDDAYSVKDVFLFGEGFSNGFQQGKVISDVSGRWLQKGYLSVSIDPRLYSDGKNKYFNVFTPLECGKDRYIAVFSMNVGTAAVFMEKVLSSSKKYVKYIMAATIFFIVLSFVVSILYSNYLTLFLESLTSVVKKAANGQFYPVISREADSDFYELALSFNSLIEDIREKDNAIRELKEKDPYDDLFKFGVNLLKESRLDESSSVFKTLIQIRPDGFGSYFNLGVIYAKRKKYEHSLNMFNKALKCNPGHTLTSSYIERIEKNLRSGESGQSDQRSA